MDSNENKLKIVMLPWLAHGHVSPFLELAKRLSKRNFHIYFCSTPIILNSIKNKINKEQSLSIQLIEFNLPSLPNLPPCNHTTNALPPHLMPTLKDALEMASPNFSTILDDLKPDLVMYDFIQHWAPTMAKSRNIRTIYFSVVSSSMICFALHTKKDHTTPFPLPEFLPQNFKGVVSRGHEHASRGYHFMELLKGSDFILTKSLLREWDGKVIDLFSRLIEKKIVTVGPLVESPINDDHESSEIIEWLDKKDEASTVFVSFGSECYLTKDELKEVANGLELSNVNFIWFIRNPVGEKINIDDALPEGFLERVGERGKIVEGWAPQMKILAHSSIGGSVSHCGWSSIIESMKFKVPIISMPMHIDNPFNARLLENIGVGIEVGRSKDGRLEGAKIAKAIRKVLLEKDGENVREKVKEVGDIISLIDETEIDGVVEELRQLCNEGK